MNNKKNIYPIWWFLLILCLATLLSVQAEQLAQESQYLSRVSLCKDVEEKNPVLETSTFFIEDEKVVCWIRFNYTSKVDFNISWEWEDPQGNIYHVGNLEMEPGTYQNYRTWYWISIRDHYAANLPGKWMVRVYIDDILVAIKDFNLV